MSKDFVIRCAVNSILEILFSNHVHKIFTRLQNDDIALHSYCTLPEAILSLRRIRMRSRYIDVQRDSHQNCQIFPSFSHLSHERITLKLKIESLDAANAV